VDNPVGVAPGLWLERGTQQVVALHGVPAELRAMYEASLAPRLAQQARGQLALRVFGIAGLTESALDARIGDFYGRPQLEVTVLGRPGGVELQLLARAADARAAASRLDQLEAELRARLGDDLYAVGSDPLAAVVARLLLESGRTIATAESCTGGLLAAALSETPGSSATFVGGFVVYADALKLEQVGVDPATLARDGAVSEGVARQLAEGARARCRTQLAVGITGIAGPGGGTPHKPVGLVHLALADGTGTSHWRLQLPGDRHAVRTRAVTVALDRLRRYLLGSA
jgi:nicotinamide-nucleotide amidase